MGWEIQIRVCEHLNFTFIKSLSVQKLEKLGMEYIVFDILYAIFTR